MASTCTSMPMIRRSTSALRPARDAESRLTSHCVSRPHRGLAERQQTPAEPHQDSGYVVGFSPAAGQSQRLRSASDVDTYQCLKRWRMTLESSLTVSCRSLHRWPPCVAVDITNYASSDRPSNLSAEAVKTLVQACLLYTSPSPRD